MEAYVHAIYIFCKGLMIFLCKHIVCLCINITMMLVSLTSSELQMNCLHKFYTCLEVMV